MYKKGAMAETDRPEVTRDEERGRLFDWVYLPAEFAAGDREWCYSRLLLPYLTLPPLQIFENH